MTSSQTLYRILEQTLRRLPVLRTGFNEADILRARVDELQSKLFEAQNALAELTTPELIETTQDGLTYLTPAGDFSSVQMLSGITYEEHVQTRLLDDAKTARNAIDVGANVGLIALPLARALRGVVYCFELSPRNAKILYKNACRNNLNNIKIFPLGIGEVLDARPLTMNSHTSLNVANQDAGMDALFDTWTYMVPFLSLDTMFANGPPIDLLKIDVDGWDYQALNGARRLIQQWSPIIYTEYAPELITAHSGSNNANYLAILTEMGYRAEILGPYVPSGPPPTQDPEQFAAYISDLLKQMTHMRLAHVDIRWHRPT